MKSEFVKVKLGDVIEFNPKEKLKKGNPYKKIKMECVKEFTKKIACFELAPYNGGAKFRNGDVLLAKITPCLENGKSAFVDILDNDEVAFGSTEFIVLRATDKTDGNFIYYLTLFSSFRKKAILAMEGTSGRKRVNENTLKNYNILLPTLKTQKKIAHILSVIDEKIELNKKINKKLEELARLLYEYYFVQFDFPDINGKPYKSSGGEMVYNEKLKRKIPKGWEVETILDSKITKIISPNIKKFKNKKIYLSTSDVEGSEIVNHKTLITFDNRPSRAAMQPLENSIWFARMKNTKKRILVSDFSDYLINNYIFSTGFAGLKVKKNALYYVWEYVNSEKFEELKDKFATGSTQKAITNEGLKNIYILIPSDSILSKFNLSVKPIFQQIYNNQLQIQKLEKLRDFLLPMLLNGQVTISEKWKVEN